jgi:hypothetical protein
VLHRAADGNVVSLAAFLTADVEAAAWVDLRGPRMSKYHYIQEDFETIVQRDGGLQRPDHM